MKIPFISNSNSPVSEVINSQKCINWYPELETPESKNTKALICCPGLTDFATLSGTGPVRGLFTTANGRCFGVVGEEFYEINADGTTSGRGTVSSNSGPVRMAESSEGKIVIVDGEEGKVFTLATNNYATIGGDFPDTATYIVQIDGYFVVNVPATGQLRWSALINATSWPTGNVAIAEGSPDNIEGLLNVRNQCWVFGSKTTEVYYDTGVSGSEFGRYPGGLNNKGCYAPNSLAQIHGHAFWLGSSDEGNNIVYMSEGYEAVQISDYALEEKISEYAHTDDAVGYTYTQRGHSFYVLTFQTGNATWVYDLDTRVWHQRAYLNEGTQERHLGLNKTSFNNKTYIGSRLDGTVYELDFDKYTDDSAEIRRTMETPPIHHDRKRLFISDFEVDMDRGEGLVTGQGSDPVAMIEKSKDGGRTWGAERFVSTGAMGKYLTRINAHRWGTGRDIRFRFSISDPVKSNLVAGHMEASGEK